MIRLTDNRLDEADKYIVLLDANRLCLMDYYKTDKDNKDVTMAHHDSISYLINNPC